MSASGTTSLLRTGTPVASARRLAVAWQHPETRRVQPVGLLWHDHEDSHYKFRYVRNALHVKDFRPFISFPDLGRAYRSTRLFPLFAQRVMDPRRPDFGRYVSTLDLPVDVSPWEQMARSEGRRAGDSIMVFPEPVVLPGGRTESFFLVHGVRHALAEAPQPVESRLRQLRPGAPLALTLDPVNAFNPRAIQVTRGGLKLGWVPDVLLDYVHTVRRSGPFSLSAQHVNGPDAPVHLRLLVKLAGTVPAGHVPFSGRTWAEIG